MSETAVVKKPKKLKKILLLVVNILVIAALGFGTVFFYLKYKDVKNNNLTPDQRIAKYEKEISKTYTLPTGDKPTLADVKSAADLKKDDANKEFFKDSADGDILLVYTNSKLGILYRPSSKKIIKAGPVAFKQQVSTEIFGSKTDRAAAGIILKNAFSGDIVVSTEIETKAPLTSTIVVDVSGKNAELVAKLATELKGKVGTVPDGQDKPLGSVGIAIYVGAATTPTAPTVPVNP